MSKGFKTIEEYREWEKEHPTDGSRLRKKKPLPVWVLVDAQQDSVHIDIGKSRPARSVRSKAVGLVKEETGTKENE